ncbi:MAG: ABC transporter permease [Oscillospiraceae bacterium]|jgi:putative ABC transport system permease protein|nr:ABC transporter permease [Oscillospiraceae bacterium]
MRIRNRAVIRKITRRNLRGNSARNFFLFAAIMLTTFMIASVLSVYMSFNGTMERDAVRRAGTRAHLFVHGVTPPTAEYMKKLTYVEDVGVASIAAAVNIDDTQYHLGYCDDAMWERLMTPAYSNVTGAYPVGEFDIMLPLGVLKGLGITDPAPGMPVMLEGMSFTLSGFYTDYQGTWMDYRILPVSKTFADSAGGGAECIAGIAFRDKRDIYDGWGRLNSDLRQYTGETFYMSVYGVSSVSNPFGTAAVYGVIIAFLMFTGFLLIYNVMTISVSNDVRFYGLLKTIGATARQLRSIVVGQALWLCAAAIPVGAGLAAALSLAVVPYILKSYTVDSVTSFSPYIYLGAALFALITALLGAALPAWKTSRTSPVEATKYTGETLRYTKKASPCRREADKRTRVLFPGRANPYRMALRNLFRNRRRTTVVFLSLFLGLTMFLTVATVSGSLDADKYASEMENDDFHLRYQPRNGAMFPGESGLAPVPQKFDEAYLQRLRDLPGFISMWTVTEAKGLMTYTDAFEKHLDGYVEYILGMGGASGFDPERLRESLKMSFQANIYAIDKGDIEELNKRLAAPLDAEAFERGEFVLIATDTPEIYADVGEVEVAFDGGSFKLPVMGFAPERFKGFLAGNVAPCVFTSKALLERFAEPAVYSIGIKVRTQSQREAYGILSEMTAGDGDVYMTSRVEAYDEVRGAQALFWVVGGSISGILGLIGVLNFVNVLTVGILSRRRELATLEACGMSKGQTRRMVLAEGIGYAAIALLSAATLGNAVAFGAYSLLKGTQGADDLFTFAYPVIPVAVVAAAILLICIATPGLAYRSTRRATLSERLRAAE